MLVRERKNFHSLEIRQNSCFPILKYNAKWVKIAFHSKLYKLPMPNYCPKVLLFPNK